ncbi:hypothetical protein [uncultured Erwinia sp.]|uniref:hypothetical protein n=1 Tax=uncultured Erwinia sp. TaxID=246798 RepID=UPI0025829263|nr:hypothetical protein [uncultured Erwinia sp.]
MEKIENVTVTIIEDIDFTAPEHAGDLNHLTEEAQWAFVTSDIVIYAGRVVKNRHHSATTCGVE